MNTLFCDNKHFKQKKNGSNQWPTTILRPNYSRNCQISILIRSLGSAVKPIAFFLTLLFFRFFRFIFTSISWYFSQVNLGKLFKYRDSTFLFVNMCPALCVLAARLQTKWNNDVKRKILCCFFFLYVLNSKLFSFVLLLLLLEYGPLRTILHSPLCIQCDDAHSLRLQTISYFWSFFTVFSIVIVRRWLLLVSLPVLKCNRNAFFMSYNNSEWVSAYRVHSNVHVCITEFVSRACTLGTMITWSIKWFIELGYVSLTNGKKRNTFFPFKKWKRANEHRFFSHIVAPLYCHLYGFA